MRRRADALARVPRQPGLARLRIHEEQRALVGHQQQAPGQHRSPPARSPRRATRAAGLSRPGTRPPGHRRRRTAARPGPAATSAPPTVEFHSTSPGLGAQGVQPALVRGRIQPARVIHRRRGVHVEELGGAARQGLLPLRWCRPSASSATRYPSEKPSVHRAVLHQRRGDAVDGEARWADPAGTARPTCPSRAPPRTACRSPRPPAPGRRPAPAPSPATRRPRTSTSARPCAHPARTGCRRRRAHRRRPRAPGRRREAVARLEGPLHLAAGRHARGRSHPA